MSDTPKEGETAKTEELKNNGTPTSTQPQGNASDPALEQARKEAEQARMRANQLENDLKKAKEAEEARKRAELEKNEEYKQLAEQERAKREELEQRFESQEKEQSLKVANKAVFAEFPDEVVEIAKEAGLGVSDDSDEARAALKTKLENISKRVVKDSKPTPNNQPAPTNTDSAQLLERMKYGDKTARQEVISNIPAVQEMRRQAGLSE